MPDLKNIIVKYGSSAIGFREIDIEDCVHFRGWGCTQIGDDEIEKIVSRISPAL
jgi:hypothetical protein